MQLNRGLSVCQKPKDFFPSNSQFLMKGHNKRLRGQTVNKTVTNQNHTEPKPLRYLKLGTVITNTNSPKVIMWVSANFNTQNWTINIYTKRHCQNNCYDQMIRENSNLLMTLLYLTTTLQNNGRYLSEITNPVIFGNKPEHSRKIKVRYCVFRIILVMFWYIHLLIMFNVQQKERLMFKSYDEFQLIIIRDIFKNFTSSCTTNLIKNLIIN